MTGVLYGVFFLFANGLAEVRRHMHSGFFITRKANLLRGDGGDDGRDDGRYTSVCKGQTSTELLVSVAHAFVA